MRNGGGWLDEVELEAERLEEGRCGNQRMDGRADVVAKAGERELSGARPAADRLLRLEDEDRPAGLRKRDRSGEPVGSGTDDDGV
jgi:hypothetical protein